mgnify:CR=1 FL=1
MIQEKQIRILPEQAVNVDNIRNYILQEGYIDENSLTGLRVLKRSIDARQRTIYINLTIRLYINEPMEEGLFAPIAYKAVDGCPAAIVVGAGPGGLFAALKLIELGIRPIVVERGKDVHSRRKDVSAISTTHSVDPESNYCFGEGGAGAFSDGKLYTRSKKRGDIEKILRVFCQHGADPSILTDSHPHIGTNKLPSVIESMRNTIIRCGGEVHFQTKMTGLLISGEKVEGIEVESLNPSASTLKTSQLYGPVILATGHSARDVYRWFDSHGIEIESKGIAVGTRLEHPAHLIDCIQYHSRDGKGKYLPTAEYSFVNQVDGRGVYSFCMCPGGTVVPAASGPRQLVVNGMSSSLRNSPWSNSGMVVELRPEDLDSDKLLDASALKHMNERLLPENKRWHSNGNLAMMYFQEYIEELAWIQGNRRQTAPAQRMSDFVNSRLSSNLPESSYSAGLISTPMDFWLPPFISQRLQKGFMMFGKRSHGFLTNDACLIGMESRTSSPVRILRDRESLHHVRFEGLYPCGEGAGYAGGIVSAGIDGERCAEQVALRIRN